MSDFTGATFYHFDTISNCVESGGEEMYGMGLFQGPSVDLGKSGLKSGTFSTS